MIFTTTIIRSLIAPNEVSVFELNPRMAVLPPLPPHRDLLPFNIFQSQQQPPPFNTIGYEVPESRGLRLNGMTKSRHGLDSSRIHEDRS